MSQETTNTAEWLAAGELERRQHILVKGGGESTVFKVEHSLPYRSGPDQMVALALSPIGGGEPQGVKWSADYLVRLATEDQVAEASDAAHRRELVAGLRELANLIEKHELRFKKWYGPSLSAGLADGEVSRVAAVAGVELTPYGSEQKQVTLELRDSDAGSGVAVVLHGRPAPEPVAPEHRHVGGSGGAPGECSAECACGVTFDGFDTIAEAVALLDQHIANPEPQEPTPASDAEQIKAEMLAGFDATSAETHEPPAAEPSDDEIANEIDRAFADAELATAPTTQAGE